MLKNLSEMFLFILVFMFGVTIGFSFLFVVLIYVSRLMGVDLDSVN